MDYEAFVADAFAQLGIVARPPDGAPDTRVDLGWTRMALRSLYGSSIALPVTPDVAERLLANAPTPDATLIVVADRVTAGHARRSSNTMAAISICVGAWRCAPIVWWSMPKSNK